MLSLLPAPNPAEAVEAKSRKVQMPMVQAGEVPFELVWQDLLEVRQFPDQQWGRWDGGTVGRWDGGGVGGWGGGVVLF